MRSLASSQHTVIYSYKDGLGRLKNLYCSSVSARIHGLFLPVSGIFLGMSTRWLNMLQAVLYFGIQRMVVLFVSSCGTGVLAVAEIAIHVIYGGVNVVNTQYLRRKLHKPGLFRI